MKTELDGTTRPHHELERKRQLFIAYCAAMKCDPETGEKITMANFAKKIKVDYKTLFVWQQMPGHADAVADATDDQLLRDLPMAAKIIRKHALKGSYNHLKLWYMQSDRLKAEKQEHSGEITHKFEDLDDEALDRIIQARQDRIS